MKLRYTQGAARQIEAALAYIEKRSPQGATKVRDRIVGLERLLVRHTLAGQKTDRIGVRRLVLSPYPYLIFYRIIGDEIVVSRFRHAARDPTGSVD